MKKKILIISSPVFIFIGLALLWWILDFFLESWSGFRYIEFLMSQSAIAIFPIVLYFIFRSNKYIKYLAIIMFLKVVIQIIARSLFKTRVYLFHLFTYDLVNYERLSFSILLFVLYIISLVYLVFIIIKAKTKLGKILFIVYTVYSFSSPFALPVLVYLILRNTYHISIIVFGIIYIILPLLFQLIFMTAAYKEEFELGDENG